MDETRDLIKMFYQMLPDAVQTKVIDPAWTVRVHDIAKKFGLTEEQAEKLKLEVLFVMLAIEDESILEVNIEDKLGLEPSVAERIGESIRQSILEDIQDDLNATVSEIDTTARQLNNPTTSNQSKITSAITTSGPGSSIQPKTAPAPSNLPAMPEEREVALRKITTNNPILNKQLENPTPEALLKPKPQIPNTPASRPVFSFGEQKVQVAPQPAKPQSGSILEARLGGSFSMPQEEVNVTKPSQPAPAQYPKNDPYREPIE